MVELLAPVGNWTMLRAAVKAGADAVYFGVKGFNMRASSINFDIDEIKEVIDYCHQNNVKAYCTVNIIILEQEIEKLHTILQTLQDSNIDAVICWDFAVIQKCKELHIPIHLSTQASVSNSQSALQWKEFGVERIVLARECSLEDVKDIKEKTNMEIEVFVHGARCISLSGRCFMSQELFGKSANKGECLQPCRREYTVTDEEGKQMVMDNNFIMSAKDLCALPLLPKLMHVDCLKIEGRNRSADYVFKVVSVYKEALDAINNNTFSDELITKLTSKLREVYNKDFSQGFLIEYPHHERCNEYGSKATTRKILIGKVSNFYSKINVAEFTIESEGFKLGDTLSFEGPTTGYHQEIVSEVHTDNGKKEEVKKGEIVSVKLNSKVRENDKVYLITKRE
ncbi:U32 family peptidase [Candidatus Woesearchaeota archaeon]|jgi:U32 family peptidase|nr:U32 family peptidase [Candidatus Woesearchaeota archaeon]MBT5396612.1 U32 family peptidase [Candidatus Woesearchaeota archaeon]MBT7763100.1 U32 family peptidase [Candidatus Woesearchaeota archaeon]